MRHNQKGFSFVEMVVVIGIIAVLTGILVPAIVAKVDDANKTKALQDAQVIYEAAQKAILNANTDPTSSSAYAYLFKFKDGPNGITDGHYGKNSSRSFAKYLLEYHYHISFASQSQSKSAPADRYICEQLAKEVPGAISVKVDQDKLQSMSDSKIDVSCKTMADNPNVYGTFPYTMCFDQSGKIIYFQCVYQGYFIQFDEQGNGTVEKASSSQHFYTWPSVRWDYANKSGADKW